MRRPITLIFVLAVLPAFAAPEPALEPLAFLAGHCWKGQMPGSTDTDEHCFSWMHDGRQLRDRHAVRRGDKTVYEGESIYFWNSVERRVEYFYVTAAGGQAMGQMAVEADALVFPVARLSTGGKSLAFRGRWKRVGTDAYEVLREYETDKGWMPVAMLMKRQ